MHLWWLGGKVMNGGKAASRVQLNEMTSSAAILLMALVPPLNPYITLPCGLEALRAWLTPLAQLLMPTVTFRSDGEMTASTDGNMEGRLYLVAADAIQRATRQREKLSSAGGSAGDLEYVTQTIQAIQHKALRNANLQEKQLSFGFCDLT